MTEWLVGARGGVAVAVLGAALAGELAAATLIPGSPVGTSTGSARLLAGRSDFRLAPDPMTCPPATLGLDAAAKRRVEAQLHERICARAMAVAQGAMVLKGNWEDQGAR